jgi:hypothetical protein
VIQEWSARQIHDTVAAIVRQPDYGAGARRSMLSRFLEFVLRWLDKLLDRAGGTLNGKFIVAAAIVLVVVLVVGRMVVERQVEARRGRLRRSAQNRGVIVDRRQLARDSAAAGRFEEACHALYLAVLDELVAAGALKLHRSKTSGDYARDLKRRGVPAAAAFREFARTFERAVYAGDRVTESDYERVAAASERVVVQRAAA